MRFSLHLLWSSLTRLYDEVLLMARANLVWFLLTLPLHGLLLLLALLLFEARLEAGVPSIMPLLAAAFLGLALPTPAAAGLYRLAQPVVNGETTAFSTYWSGLRRYWLQGTVMFLLGLVGISVAIFNMLFYFQAGGVLQLLSIAWAYAGLLWLAMQVYLYPLLLTFPGDSIIARYKRAALLALGNPTTSLVLLACAFLLTAVSVFVPPLYPVLAMAFLSLAGSTALAELRERHGHDSRAAR